MFAKFSTKLLQTSKGGQSVVFYGIFNNNKYPIASNGSATLKTQQLEQ